MRQPKDKQKRPRKQMPKIPIPDRTSALVLSRPAPTPHGVLPPLPPPASSPPCLSYSHPA